METKPGGKAKVRLRQISTANDCREDWDGMQGKGAKRFCHSCKKSVYNLSAMSEEDALALLDAAEAHCIRYSYRPDGTIVAQSPEQRAAPRRASASLAAGVAALVAAPLSFSSIRAAEANTGSHARREASESSAVRVAMGMKLRVGPARLTQSERPGRVLVLGRKHAELIAHLEEIGHTVVQLRSFRDLQRWLQAKKRSQKKGERPVYFEAVILEDVSLAAQLRAPDFADVVVLQWERELDTDANLARRLERYLEHRAKKLGLANEHLDEPDR